MKIIQIGTNKGFDNLTDILNTIPPNNIEFLLFIEPLYFCNESIKKCYQKFNFIIENIAITDNPNEKTITFYTSEKYHRLSSIDKNHILKHKVQTEIIELNVKCMTISEIFDKYSITQLDILFVDAESYDHKIIKSIDFDNIKIDTIYYEFVHGENKYLHEFLENKNYEVTKSDFQDGLTNIAILKK
jgi:FkbM family methyltransferase